MKRTVNFNYSVLFIFISPNFKLGDFYIETLQSYLIALSFYDTFYKFMMILEIFLNILLFNGKI